MRLALITTLAVVIATLGALPTRAASVGERHLTASTASARLRNANHSPDLRITVWYPSIETPERSLDIGPKDSPIFSVGSAAPDAQFVDDTRRPVVLFSHGYGGTSRMMGWFCTGLARAGYIVIAVDHPGNNGAETMTPEGSALIWERPDDLRTALSFVLSDPAIEAHVAPDKIGVAGFSAGGFTALIAAGARVDAKHLDRFCRTHRNDGVCVPQKEFPITMAERREVLAAPTSADSVARAGADHSLTKSRAVFLLAPALVQAISPRSWSSVAAPVFIVAGEMDETAPPETNAFVVSTHLPSSTVQLLSGVRHYDFLSTCTKLGLDVEPLCKDVGARQVEAHDAALKSAVQFFNRELEP